MDCRRGCAPPLTLTKPLLAGAGLTCARSSAAPRTGNAALHSASLIACRNALLVCVIALLDLRFGLWGGRRAPKATALRRRAVYHTHVQATCVLIGLERTH